MLDLESLKNSIIYYNINNGTPDEPLCTALQGCPQAARITLGGYNCNNCIGNMLYIENTRQIEPNITIDNFVATMTLAIAIK